MGFDLLTLYSLAIGTLLLSAAMTLWERQARPARRSEMTLLAAGYAVLAAGCALATIRTHFPGASGAALSNVVMVAGYLLILNGIAAFDGRSHRVVSACVLAAVALGWAIGGAPWSEMLWAHVSAFPIAAICGATAWEMWRNDHLRSLRARHMVILFTAAHGLFYAGRTFILPLIAAEAGPPALALAATLTMYEGVLYSVGLPMALLALVREEAHAEILTASRTDYLTALANRRWFFEEGERLVRAAGRHEPVSLLAFDLDHFKTINDRFGHDKGDEILTLFAGVVRGAAGDEALVARIGGEEFAALLPGKPRSFARDMAQTVASRFAEAALDPEIGPGVAATVSIGLAELGPGEASLADLLSAADRALYLAKERGRNRIELARPVALAAAG